MKLLSPTLSVVIPNYNDGRFIAQQLRALLDQSRKPDEIIIVDDASTDDSVKIIEGFIDEDSRIRLIRNPRNQGVVANNNRLLAEARGSYIYFGAADDLVLPGFFEESLKLLMKHPDANLCSGLGRTMNEGGRDTGLRSLPVISSKPCYLTPSEVQEALLRYGRWFAISSMIVRRDALLQEGGQLTELGSFADTITAMVLALRGGVCFVPKEFSYFRHKAGSHGRSADWRSLSKTGDLAVSLMRTKYGDLFPERYTVIFSNHWKYSVQVTAATQLRSEISAAFQDLKHESTIRVPFVDRMSLIGIDALIALAMAIWRCYAAVRLGPWKWWIIGRLSIIRNHGVLVMIEDQRP